MTVTMTAFPDMVFADQGVPEFTAVNYSAGAGSFLELFLWERTGTDPWVLADPLVDRLTEIPTGDANEAGMFRTKIFVGDIYRARIYHTNEVDPNNPMEGDPEPDAQVTVVGLQRGPESTNLFTDENRDRGGTWLQWSIFTRPPTFAVLQVSKEPPVTDAQGLKRFLSPLASVASEGMVDTHHLEVASPNILPGSLIWGLVRMTDADGNWQFRAHRFFTKRRKVTLTFDEVHIINDGADGENTASFRIWTLEGKELVGACALPERDISDRPSPGEEYKEHIDLSGSCSQVVLGPKSVNVETMNVGILTRGIASVTIGQDDVSGNFLPGPPAPSPTEFNGTPLGGVFFRFPIGSFNESISNQPFTVRAVPLTGNNEFEYSVRAKVTVEYI